MDVLVRSRGESPSTSQSRTTSKTFSQKSHRKSQKVTTPKYKFHPNIRKEETGSLVMCFWKSISPAVAAFPVFQGKPHRLFWRNHENETKINLIIRNKDAKGRRCTPTCKKRQRLHCIASMIMQW